LPTTGGVVEDVKDAPGAAHWWTLCCWYG
jgi:hypothetical protein